MPSRRPQRQSSASGQAAVETALVMPLFVFIIAGTLQLNLMNQARLLTKYAAYKAVRAGALRSAKMDVMEQAALGVLLPMISYEAGKGQELHFRTKTAREWADAIAQSAIKENKMPESSKMKFVKIVVCGPTKEMLRDGTRATKDGESNEYDFDDATNATSSDWKKFERTKLFIQVTFNYRMEVPFANMMLYQIARGQEQADLMWVARMGDKQTKHFLRDYDKRNDYDALAKGQNIYVLPIRAQWGMRMQSNLYPEKDGYAMPAESLCYVPFPKKDESDPASGTLAPGGGGGDDPDNQSDPGDPGD